MNKIDPIDEDATATHERLGTEEFCRRIAIVDVQRGPLIARRDVLQSAAFQADYDVMLWMDAHEVDLPKVLQQLRQQARTQREEAEALEKRCQQMWREVMAAPNPQKETER